MTDIRFDGAVFRRENGAVCKDPEAIRDFLSHSQANISDEKMPVALKHAYKCIKSKDTSTFITNILAEILIGGAAVVATLATYSPIFLLINALSIAVAVYGLKVDGNLKRIIEDLKAKCRANNIPFDDVFGMAKVKEKQKESSKSHIHEVVASREAATNNMTTTTITAVPVNEGMVDEAENSSPLSGLGAMFKASGSAPATETVEEKAEGLSLEEVEAGREDFTGNIIDGDKISIGSLADRMKNNALAKKKTATTPMPQATVEPHFKTPKLNPVSTVESVQSQNANSSSMSDMLSKLKSARANKVIDDVASVDVSSNTIEENITEEPENKQ